MKTANGKNGVTNSWFCRTHLKNYAAPETGIDDTGENFRGAKTVVVEGVDFLLGVKAWCWT